MKVPPNIHEDSYQELVSAQKEYRNQEECPRLEGNEEIGQLANRFLNLGGTSHFLRLNALIFDDTIKNIIACGYGSHLLEELAKFEPNMYTHEYAVAMFVMLCNWDLTPTVIINQQHQNYLDALRTATIALFKHLFRMPYELSQFLVLTRTTEWTTQYRLTIIMWYMEKTEDELVLYTRYWPIVGNFTHLKLWKLCKDEFVDLSHYLRILDLLERTEIYGLRALPQIKPVVDIMGARLTVFHLGKYRIVRELKRYDREVIEALLNDEHWVEQASALNILITRKHYESNINIRQDIRMCGLFSDAYRRMCKSDTDISHRVCVITGVFSAESKKKESLMLESTDITAALMEDLMRNKNAKMYTSHRPMNLVGFYSKYELEMGPLYAWQHCKYNPRLIFECATRNHIIFDFFVLVCITSQSIPVAGVILMFDNYKRLVNSNAKFIIIGSDSLAEYEQLGDRQDVILFSGVKSTTYHLVKLYMNLEILFLLLPTDKQWNNESSEAKGNGQMAGKAEQTYRKTMDPPPDFDEKMSVQSTKLFLAIGTTQREVLVQKFHSPRVDTIQPDKTIMELIDSGYGSFLLKELHSFYPSAATEKNGVVLFAMLCGFVFASREEKNRMETEYLDALRVATTPLFESLVHSPRMFRVFLAATKNMSISYDHSDLISSWYLKKSDEKLAYMFHFWRYGIMPHDEVWKTCKWMLTDSAFEEMANKIKNIEEHGLVDYPHLESLSGIIGDESIIRGLSNFAIAYSLTRSDRVCIRNCLGNPHYIRKTSAVEILHIRRSYESYTFFSPDIYLCNQLMNAYTDICNSDGDIAIKVLVVSMIRQGVTDEETHETSTAVLEDLMRNREAKMFAELPHTWDSQGFYSKRDGVLGKLGQVESQENDWHKIMGAAMNTKTFFECFVVVCSYFSNLTFGDILGSFESYKALVNPCAKLIVVAMNYQECTFEVGTRRDILFVNGVGELTMYQVVNFMSFQL